jgi:hypothetical protein
LRLCGSNAAAVREKFSFDWIATQRHFFECGLTPSDVEEAADFGSVEEDLAVLDIDRQRLQV